MPPPPRSPDICRAPAAPPLAEQGAAFPFSSDRASSVLRASLRAAAFCLVIPPSLHARPVPCRNVRLPPPQPAPRFLPSLPSRAPAARRRGMETTPAGMTTEETLPPCVNEACRTCRRKHPGRPPCTDKAAIFRGHKGFLPLPLMRARPPRAFSEAQPKNPVPCTRREGGMGTSGRIS